MKTSIVTRYAMIALFSASFIALNNCGNQSTSDQAVDAKENGQASDLLTVGVPTGYDSFAILPETNCNNGRDEDGNGLTDCMDPACHIHPECAEFGPPLEELINGRATTVYPNGIIVPEDVAFLKARGADDDDAHGWQRDQFFATHVKDCWVAPVYQDPYYNIDLGEPLVAGPDGPIGPQLGTLRGNVIGPRAGLINECEPGTDVFNYHYDDDNGPGAGASGDWDDDEGGADNG